MAQKPNLENYEYVQQAPITAQPTVPDTDTLTYGRIEGVLPISLTWADTVNQRFSPVVQSTRMTPLPASANVSANASAASQAIPIAAAAAAAAIQNLTIPTVGGVSIKSTNYTATAADSGTLLVFDTPGWVLQPNYASSAGYTGTAYNGNTTQGSLLIVIVSYQAGPPIISDTLGNSWTVLYDISTTGGNAFLERCAYAINKASGPNTVSTTGASSADPGIEVIEFLGVATSFPVDDTTFHSGQNGTTMNSASVTTTVANELVIGCFMPTSAASTTTGWLTNTTLLPYGGLIYAVQPTTGTYTPTATQSNSGGGNYGNGATGFKPVAGISLTLPPAARKDWYIYVTNDGLGNLTINPNGLELDFSTSNLILEPNQGIYIASDGSNYYSVRGVESIINGFTGAVTLAAGSGISVTDTSATNTITVANTGVLTVNTFTGAVTVAAGTGIGVANATGTVTVSLTTPVSIANGGTGTSSPGIVAGTGISVSGSFPTQSVALSTPVSVANGGSGTSTPGLVAGTNVTITGSWPNQTISASGGSGTPGGSNTDVQYNNSGSFGGNSGFTYDGSGNVYMSGALGIAQFPSSPPLGNGTINVSSGYYLGGTEIVDSSANIHIPEKLYDGTGSAGTNGQVLSSTGTATAWTAAAGSGGGATVKTTNYTAVSGDSGTMLAFNTNGSGTWALAQTATGAANSATFGSSVPAGQLVCVTIGSSSSGTPTVSGLGATWTIVGTPINPGDGYYTTLYYGICVTPGTTVTVSGQGGSFPGVGAYAFSGGPSSPTVTTNTGTGTGTTAGVGASVTVANSLVVMYTRIKNNSTVGSTTSPWTLVPASGNSTNWFAYGVTASTGTITPLLTMTSQSWGSSTAAFTPTAGLSLTLKLPSSPPNSTWNIWTNNCGTGTLTINPNGPNLNGSSSNITCAQNTGHYITTDGTNYFYV